jgi:hypothetical protein
VAAAVALAAAITILLTPSKPAAPVSAWHPRHAVVAGAFHVHTNRSPDSSASLDEAVAAANRAGLQFVVSTEHGDGTREPLVPAYRDGVLWIEGVEISTTDGHYATAGMSRAPYVLAGEGRDVADDVRRLGGFGVAAHGDSPKSEAQWRDWHAPIDGLEWLNLDSVWREAGLARLARATITYWFRGPATLASLGSRPDATLRHVDARAEHAHTIVIAASDAHGAMIPSYEACFEAFSTRVELDAPLTGNASRDAAAIIAALRSGHHYTSIDALAPPAFEFSAREGATTATEGDVLPEGESVTFDIHAAGPAGARSALLRNGVPVQDSLAPSWHHETSGQPAEYRVEVTLPSSPGQPPLPWIVSNPIFVGLPRAESAPASGGPADVKTLVVTPPLAWRVEKDGASTADASSTASDVRLQYALGEGAPRNQFAAAAAPAPATLAAARGITFTVQAQAPVRFSVEIRGAADHRWHRSVYADATPRQVTVAFDDMRPVEPNADPHPDLSHAEAILFLVGVSNTVPGSSGTLSLSDVSLIVR